MFSHDCDRASSGELGQVRAARATLPAYKMTDRHRYVRARALISLIMGVKCYVVLYVSSALDLGRVK